MSDEYNGSGLSIENAFGGTNIIGQRGQRNLHRSDHVAVAFQNRNNLVPAAGVSKCAVNEYDARLLCANGSGSQWHGREAEQRRDSEGVHAISLFHECVGARSQSSLERRLNDGIADTFV